MPSPADLAFLRFQATGRADALAEVFDLTAADLLRVVKGDNRERTRIAIGTGPIDVTLR